MTTKTKVILAAALSLGVNVSAVLGGSLPAPKAVCGISTVSYRFVGTPGTEFRYGRDSYRVPPTGAIELLAEKRISDYRLGELSLPLNVGPQDQFGTRIVALPSQMASK